MPDHVHYFVSPSEDARDLETWIRYWKRLFGQALDKRVRLWQEDDWDTRMRTKEQYYEKLDYVWLNPVRAGLVERPEEWPYAGEVNELIW